MEVGLVLDADFGTRLEALTLRMPVWVVDTLRIGLSGLIDHQWTIEELLKAG